MKLSYSLLLLALLLGLIVASVGNNQFENIIGDDSNTISDVSSPLQSNNISEDNFVAFTNFSKCRIDPSMKYTSVNDDYFRQTHGNYLEIGDDEDALNVIYAKDYFDPNSTNYNTLTDDDTIIKHNDSSTTLIEDKVLYIDFTIDSRYTPKQEWIDYFKKELEKETGKTDIPIIITEMWAFKLNGVELISVNASNAVNLGCNLLKQTNNSIEIIVSENDFSNIADNITVKEDGLVDDKYYMYTMSGVFFEESAYTVSQYCTKVAIQDKYSLPSLDYPKDGTPFYYNYNMIQYNSNSEIITYPVFLTDDSQKFSDKFHYTQTYSYIGDNLFFDYNAFSSMYNYMKTYKIYDNTLIETHLQKEE